MITELLHKGESAIESEDQGFYQFRNRMVTYRYVLLIAAIILAPIDANNIILGNTVPAVAGIGLLFIFLLNIFFTLGDRQPFLSPVAVLVLTLVMLLVSQAYDETYSMYWIYPILVALPVLLKLRLSVWLGVSCAVFVGPSVFMRFDIDTAVIVCLSMLHTWLFSAWFSYVFDKQSERLKKLAITDSLTGAYNRRHLNEMAAQLLETNRRHGRLATMLLLDVDKFKEVNDDLGHTAGDHALVELVRVIKSRIRRVDHIYRYGGEEFVVMLPETTGVEAIKVAEDIRATIEQAIIVPGRVVTISGGLCELPTEGDVDTWLRYGEEALYKAKALGRNRIVVSDLSDTQPVASN